MSKPESRSTFADSMHVLVFEKNSALSRFLKETFQSESLTFRTFETTADHFVEEDLEKVPPEVVLFDSDGFSETDFQDLYRSFKQEVPIVVLTSKAGAKGRIAFLERGASDCLTKPIDGQELLLRLYLVCRRYHQSRVQELDPNIQIDENRRDLFVDGKPSHLNHHEYLLAENFFYHPGKVFGRMALLELVWHRHQDLESNVVESTISSLRKKLKKCGAMIEIKSRRNMGYWLEPRANEPKVFENQSVPQGGR